MSVANFGIKNVFYEFLLSESVRVLKTVKNIAKEAIKAHVIDVKIAWVSKFNKFKSDTCDHAPNYVTNKALREPITIENFVIVNNGFML